MSLEGKDPRYDMVIIGSGQAGTPLARAFARAGRKTALVERTHVGGTCINEGCTPTKTMVASARIAYLVRRAGQYGVRTGSVTPDMDEVRARKRRIVEMFRSAGQRGLEETPGLDLLFGQARFTDARRVAVSAPDGASRVLTAGTIVLNTGARPSRPPIPGLDAVPALDSTSIMELDAVPDHLLVLGGGYIGLEFGQLFRRLGSHVTIVQRGGQLLPREDPDVAEEITRILREDEVEVLLNTAARSVARASDGGIVLTVGTGAFLRYTKLGTAMRAMANDRVITATLGVPVRRVEAAAWFGCGILAGFAGLLLADLVQLDATTLTFYVISSLAAALIAQLRSIAVTFVAAIVIGVIHDMLTPFTALTNYRDMTPFVLAAIALLWASRHRTVMTRSSEEA